MEELLFIDSSDDEEFENLHNQEQQNRNRRIIDPWVYKPMIDHLIIWTDAEFFARFRLSKN